MAKIAMIGAGSIVFCKTLMMDIMATEALRNSTIVLMNRTNRNGKLDKIEEFAQKVVKENNLPTRIIATLDRREARDMAIELYETEKEYLPQFDDKKIKRVPTVEIPEGTEGVQVPLDPALAIAHRFGELEEK